MPAQGVNLSKILLLWAWNLKLSLWIVFVMPLETTFVCVAPLTGNSGVTWETSHVRHKLKRVLSIRLKASAASRWRSVA